MQEKVEVYMERKITTQKFIENKLSKENPDEDRLNQLSSRHLRILNRLQDLESNLEDLKRTYNKILRSRHKYN